MDVTIMIDDEDYHFKNFYDTETNTEGVSVYDSEMKYIQDIYGYSFYGELDDEEFDKIEKEVVKILRENLHR